MGLAGRALAEEPTSKSPEGLERLVGLLQETPVPKLVPTLIGQLEKGVTLRQLVAAGALVNAHAFGGHDYDGYHTFMALAPSFAMAQELPEKERALPVIKVLHRNARTMNSGPGKRPDRLGPVEPAELKGDEPVGKQLAGRHPGSASSGGRQPLPGRRQGILAGRLQRSARHRSR